MKRVLASLIAGMMILGSFGSFSTPASSGLSDLIKVSTEIPYCDGSEEENCGLQRGIEQIQRIEDLETERSASEYVQDVVAYILSFLAIITVVVIIYAGFVILTSVGNDEKVSSAKNTLLSSLIGLGLIFLAFPIAQFIIDVLTTTQGTA
ncbi:hypothetical protein MK079_00505 [Candidatus Gracilibacteria bacterium]|nr:hypothetical protein [Candidatus Gracilibacteria bacterium]